MAVHRELIIMLAARHRLPAVYPFGYLVTSGGLLTKLSGFLISCAMPAVS
jgi:hypothetical protein